MCVMRKIFLLILLAVWIFSLSSCSSNSVEVIPEYAVGFDSEDFQGLEISVFYDSDHFFGYMEDTPAYDSLSKRIQDVRVYYSRWGKL